MKQLKNILEKAHSMLGWKTSRKLVVINSDDWGGVRIESVQNRLNLIAEGFSMDGNRFNRFDMLESNEDLEQLFLSLRKFKDSKGNHPVITALTNVANPDFAKIKENNFGTYFYEPFPQTLTRYPSHDRVYDLYREGISSRIFIPEFHGREHVHVKRWMNALQASDPKTLAAFEQKFYSPDLEDFAAGSKGFSAAFDLDTKEELEEQKEILKSGLDLFEMLFGYRATLFTAPSLIFNNMLETELAKCGIKLVDVAKIQQMPLAGDKRKTRINFLGKKTSAPKQLYIARNAVFEPNLTTPQMAVNSCLNDIGNAFNVQKPAIISTHRAAFAGGIDEKNRETGLAAFEQLLHQIVSKWPEVEFISAAELHSIMTE